MDIEIVPATFDDKERVYEFLCQHFYSDEPLTVNLKINKPENVDDCASPKLLQNNCSFLAISRRNPGELCGVVLNEEISKNDDKVEWLDLSNQFEGQPYGKLMKFLHITHQETLRMLDTEYWTPTNTETAMETTIIATHRSYRGKNIGSRLLARTEELAREKGHRWACIECTSAYSAALVKKRSYHSFYTLLYSDYTDDAGVVVFTPPEPHVMLNALVKDLNT